MIGDILKTAVKYAKRFLGLFVNFFTEISWIVDDAASDGRLGIHTCRESHDIKQKSRYEDGVFYKATHYSLLRKLFREHPLKTSDVFVDYGCGRGRVVCVAARERVKKVIGVELQSQFVEEARANAARVKGAVSPIEIVKEDAASYDPGEGSVFFFYDSFGYETFVAVVENIRRSLEKNPRKIRIFYYDARYEDVLSTRSWLEAVDAGPKKRILVWESVG